MYFTLLCNISIFKDPSPWLEVTPQMKVENQKKPYGEESSNHTDIDNNIDKNNDQHISTLMVSKTDINNMNGTKT